MKTKSIGYLTSAIITLALASARADLAPSAAEVVKLTKAGMSKDVAAAYVRGVQAPFLLSANDILALKTQGVPSQVIVAMLDHDSRMRAQAPAVTSAAYAPPAQAYTPAPGPGYTPAPAYAQVPAYGPDYAQAPAPQEVIPVCPGPDYYWTPGYWGYNGLWIGGAWLYGGVGLGIGWPLGYGWGGYYRGWGGYRGYGGGWGGYRGGLGFRGLAVRGGGGFGGGHVGGFGGGHRGGFGGGHGGRHR